MNLFQAHNEIIIMNNKYSKFHLSLKIYGTLYNKMVCYLLINFCLHFIYNSHYSWETSYGHNSIILDIISFLLSLQKNK